MKRGFTLIELMVVVSISMVLGGIILVNYTNYTENQRNYQTAKTLVANLDYARTRAITGDKPDGCGGDLEYYQVAYTDPANFSYTMSAHCSITSDVPIQTIAVPETIFITPFTVSFYPLTKGTSVGSDVIVTFSYNSTPYYRVTITPSGSIVEEKLLP